MTNQTPLILLTNDDGVHAPGLRSLLAALVPLGRAVIIAPDRDNSAASHSLTLHRPLRVNRIDTDIFSIDGTPTDCVTLGLGKLLDQRPALVVSGINPGGNLGDDISYSGTVSAAMEATMLGVPAFAVSLAGEPPYRFDTAAGFACRMAERLLAASLPADTFLNINVPNLAPDQIAGVRLTRQGRRIYEDAIKETIDPWGKRRFWIGGGTPCRDSDAESDVNACREGYISISPLHFDLTNHRALGQLRDQWFAGAAVAAGSW